MCMAYVFSAGGMHRYHEYIDPLFGFIKRVVANDHLATEILTDVFRQHRCTTDDRFPILVQLIRCAIRIMLERQMIAVSDARKFIQQVPAQVA